MDRTLNDELWDEEIGEPDDRAARMLHAAGKPIHITRETTPDGHVIRIYPDGREELIRVDLDEAARILGR
ncbi:MAG: hypothetical protein K2X76_11995 [Sphingomonas sp.]|nr:hypothetical protein [Sphingomonas sp.]